MVEPTAALVDSFGLDEAHRSGAVSSTNEAIRDRQALRRVVQAGLLPESQLPRAPRLLTPIRTPDDAPPELKAAAAAALSLPPLVDED